MYWLHWLGYHVTWWRHQMEAFSALLAFCEGIHRSPVNSPHKGQWRGALIFSLTCAWTNGWVNNRDAGDLRRNRAHYDVTVMSLEWWWWLIVFTVSVLHFSIQTRRSNNAIITSKQGHRRFEYYVKTNVLDKCHKACQPFRSGHHMLSAWWTATSLRKEPPE